MRTFIFLASLLLLPALVWGQAKDESRTISVSGEALVKVAPDEVVVLLGVETFNADLDEAKRVNDADASKLVKAIKDLKVEDKYVQTDHMQVEVIYKTHRLQNGVEGYTARRGYSIVLKDPKLFEKLIDTALKNGGNVIRGFEFRTTELRKYRDQARAMALKAAREKAQAMADVLGCRIGSPRSINESRGYWGYWGSRWNRYSQTSQNVMQDAGGGGDTGGEAMPLGQIAIRGQVQVVFDLIPVEAGK